MLYHPNSSPAHTYLTSVLSYLSSKSSFLPFHPIVIWLGLRGPSTLRAPYRLLLNLLCTLFYVLLNSQSDDEEKKIPQTYLPENPQCGTDDQPKTSSENGPFVKEDRNTYNCALLCIIVTILCILLYRIVNGTNKLFVFVFVFVF
jgi:hypothetical protein